MTAKKKTSAEQQFSELLTAGTSIGDFSAEMDLETIEKLKESKERQKKVLKEKEVNEDMLRMVVKR